MSVRTTVTLKFSIYKGRTWLALLCGFDAKYGFNRDFIHTVERHTSRSGRTGTYTYAVADGVYEYASEGTRGFLVVENEDWREIDRAEVERRLSGEVRA